MKGTNLDTPTILRREMFDKLPPHIQEMANELAIKQMQCEVMAKKLEDETASLAARRNDLEVATNDLQKLKDDLRQKCREWVAQNNL